MLPAVSLLMTLMIQGEIPNTVGFTFPLPARKKSMPEASGAGVRRFELRGIKGWKWKPSQYFEVVPFLAAHKMNFLMNCYTNVCDIEHFAWGDSKVNRWWEPLPVDKKAWFERLVKDCRQNRIQFCFSMNPNLCSEHPLRYFANDDFESLWQHYDWMQRLGVKWFNISLDDIGTGIDGAGQVDLVNKLYRRLRSRDSQAQLIYCPTWYWGTGKESSQQRFFQSIAKDLDRDIYLFWTGDQVIGPVTRRAAESYRAAVNHRLILWDNYPVNDDNPTLHLGPVINRDPDLCDVVDGYMSNSMCQPTDSNRIPLLTCADYAYNPRAYDPIKSIGQAVKNVASSRGQEQVLRDLVLAYPGDLLLYKGQYNSSCNAVRETFSQLLRKPGIDAEAYCYRIRELARDMDRVFPKSYIAERAILVSDFVWMTDQLKKRR